MLQETVTSLPEWSASNSRRCRNIGSLAFLGLKLGSMVFMTMPRWLAT